MLLATWCAGIATPATASTLILPLRSIGVSDTTATVVGELLRGELETRGVVVSSLQAPTPGIATSPCDEVECAAAAAAHRGATNVIYGSLSRLGDKIFVRVRVLRPGDTTPWYVDQLTAVQEEDLDAVVRRVAHGIAAGQPNSERATVETVTLDETLEPRRRATRGGMGPRAGFLFPVGGGVGVHSVHIEQRRRFDAGYYAYDDVYAEQTETVLTASLGGGLLALRTYDFVLVLDVRFHHTFANFGEAGGDGASGIAVTFGTSR